MKKAVALIGLLGVLVLSAVGQTPVKANISFDFVAAGTTLPAGNYEFRVSDDFLNMSVRNLKTGKAVVIPVLTMLAAGPADVPRITFDELGDKNFLEAVWPGKEDGLLLHQTKEKHTHKTVKMD